LGDLVAADVHQHEPRDLFRLSKRRRAHCQNSDTVRLIEPHFVWDHPGVAGEQSQVSWGYLVIWVAVVLALAAAALLGNLPALVLLVVLASMFVHECGHALAAWLTRFKVLAGRLGNGPTVLRFTLGTTPLELHLFPLTGAVAALTSSPRSLRLRVAIYGAGGVTTVVAIVLIIFPLAGHDLRVALIAASIVQAINLLPIGFTVRDIPRASDGLLIGKALFGPADALQDRYVAPLLRQQYLQQFQSDPAAALVTAQTYSALEHHNGEAEVMTACARARLGEPIDVGHLVDLWNDSPPGWTDMLLAWCTDKTVRTAIDGSCVGQDHVDVIRHAIARMPDSPDLAATLARVTACATPRATPRP
jgi:hypothetical protein